MKKLLLLAALGLGLAFGGLGGASEAQAQPHRDGWHRGHGPHAMYRHGPRRHHGWDRGHHRGWYKHRPRHHRAYRY
ncbi:hypothetical protein [Bosea sp. (in: a-proteobacteria)]|uniref:hypothetical protein n=1 Tax=Bosea sp. (in: a-proteobacteria) TaxID=1871050 RepID=UPI003B3BDA17